MSTKKTWTLYLGLTSLLCMNCFQNREKLLGHYCILIFEFFQCEVISGRSVDDHFRISYFLKLIPFVLQVELRNSSL